MASLNPILGVVKRRKVIDRYKKERTIAKYLGTFSLRESRKNLKTGNYYDNLNIRTELELVIFLRSFGPGAYTVLGHKKGRHGWYVFWKGDINEEGWKFDTKSVLSKDDEKEINDYKEELVSAETVEEENEIRNNINSVKSFAKEINGSKKYGFYPYLIPSGKRGQINFWDMPSRFVEESESKYEDNREGIFLPHVNKRLIIPKSRFEEMDINEINGNFKEN